jgi:hypothetical protein
MIGIAFLTVAAKLAAGLVFTGAMLAYLNWNGADSPAHGVGVVRFVDSEDTGSWIVWDTARSASARRHAWFDARESARDRLAFLTDGRVTEADIASARSYRF